MHEKEDEWLEEEVKKWRHEKLKNTDCAGGDI